MASLQIMPDRQSEQSKHKDSASIAIHQNVGDASDPLQDAENAENNSVHSAGNDIDVIKQECISIKNGPHDSKDISNEIVHHIRDVVLYLSQLRMAALENDMDTIAINTWPDSVPLLGLTNPDPDREARWSDSQRQWAARAIATPRPYEGIFTILNQLLRQMGDDYQGRQLVKKLDEDFLDTIADLEMATFIQPQDSWWEEEDAWTFEGKPAGFW